jgi:hypothetical protein
VVTFRKRFILPAAVSGAIVSLSAYRLAEVWLDTHLVHADPPQARDEWKRPRSIALPGSVPAGPHELLVRVVNEDAPPALLVRSEALRIWTGPSWEARFMDGGWTPAGLAAAPRHTALSRFLPPAPTALGEKLPLLAAVFVVGFAIALWLERRGPPVGIPRGLASASGVRWALLLAWAFIGVHNLPRLPAYIGFDASGHLAYIRHVATGRGIPLATDGWQMFQSPLYYLVSAPFYLLFTQLFELNTARWLLRFVSLAAGAAQVEVAYVALRRTFPDREDLQAIGTAFAGLLPMNLYISQSLGNEAMAGCLSGAALLAGLGILQSASGPTRRALMLLGLWLGLALLAKVTAILLLPPLIGAVAYAGWRHTRQWRRVARDTTTVLATALAVAGWYYARNWIRLGRPFVGGWDPSRGIDWWQEPGYRTPEEFLRFGEALVHPLAAATVGFWDALYSTFWADGLVSGVGSFSARPPWNYGFLQASVLLALVPTLLLLVGAATALAGDEPRRRVPLRFALAAVGVQLATLVDVYLHVPAYAIGKAHYTLGLVVCYALLLAAGVEALGRGPLPRAVLWAALATWGAAVYAAYVVVV